MKSKKRGGWRSQFYVCTYILILNFFFWSLILFTHLYLVRVVKSQFYVIDYLYMTTEPQSPLNLCTTYEHRYVHTCIICTIRAYKLVEGTMVVWLDGIGMICIHLDFLFYDIVQNSIKKICKRKHNLPQIYTYIHMKEEDPNPSLRKCPSPFENLEFAMLSSLPPPKPKTQARWKNAICNYKTVITLNRVG